MARNKYLEIADAVTTRIFMGNNPFQAVEEIKDLSGLEKIKHFFKFSLQRNDTMKFSEVAGSVLKSPISIGKQVLLSSHTLSEIYSIFSLIPYSFLAGVWGIVALWIGFGRQSVTVTIVAAVIIAIVLCQIMAMTLNDLAGTVLFLVIGSVAAGIAWSDLKRNIADMEV